MENKDDVLSSEDFENGQNEEYLLTKEDNQTLLSMIYMDLEQICKEIEKILLKRKQESKYL